MRIPLRVLIAVTFTLTLVFASCFDAIELAAAKAIVWATSPAVQPPRIGHRLNRTGRERLQERLARDLSVQR